MVEDTKETYLYPYSDAAKALINHSKEDAGELGGSSACELNLPAGEYLKNRPVISHNKPPFRDTCVVFMSASD